MFGEAQTCGSVAGRRVLQIHGGTDIPFCPNFIPRYNRQFSCSVHFYPSHAWSIGVTAQEDVVRMTCAPR